ncbi:MAG TPA: hypothetical protein VHN20_10815 [Beijerinckiaceae bacterium]|nr:hypothetical protein [Beijerinckiaceae bacterium]
MTTNGARHTMTLPSGLTIMRPTPSYVYPMDGRPEVKPISELSEADREAYAAALRAAVMGVGETPKERSHANGSSRDSAQAGA